MGLRGRLSLEGCVATALGTTVFIFALGSSSEGSWHHFGAHAKWIALAAMVPLSIALALAKRPYRRPALPLYALAGLLLVLAFESALWSVTPERTLRYATSLALLGTVVGALGIAATRTEVARALVTGVLGGAVAVAVVGVGLFFVHHSLAVAPPIPQNPERFQGLTENPNAVSLLCALVLPLALWRVVSFRAPFPRVVAGVGLLFLFGSVLASGSKGALGAGFVGTSVFALTFDRRYRPRLVLALAVLVAFATGLVFLAATLNGSAPAAAGPTTPTPVTAPTATPTPSTPAGAKAASGASGHTTKPSKTIGGTPANPVVVGATPTGSIAVAPRLSDELGSPLLSAAPEGRTLFGTSGRAQAWVGAIHIGLERPVAGFGFGTEDLVFVDRWYFFEGNRPENSYIGIFLMLGLAGLMLLISVGIALILAARRALPSTDDRAAVAACFGVVAAGAILAIVQSYIYDVGNIGTLAFWTTAFVLAGLAGSVARGRT
jgi:hypothetical protein